ncbi:MAG: phasin family protein [Cyanobium sp.]|jgi:polyhydroxyalkanoate synthesis regulator phasin
MDANNPLQQLLLRGLGTGSLVAERLRYVSQEWVRSGKLDPSHASVLVEDVLRALRGETPGLEEQASRQLERNRDQLLQDLGLPQQRELDELRGRIDRLEQALRQRQAADPGSGGAGATPYGAPPSGI